MTANRCHGSKDLEFVLYSSRRFFKFASCSHQESCFPIQAPAARKAAEQAGSAFIEMLNPYTTRLVLPHLYAGFEGRRNWQVRFCLPPVR